MAEYRYLSLTYSIVVTLVSLATVCCQGQQLNQLPRRQAGQGQVLPGQQVGGVPLQNQLDISQQLLQQQQQLQGQSAFNVKAKLPQQQPVRDQALPQHQDVLARHAEGAAHKPVQVQSVDGQQRLDQSNIVKLPAKDLNNNNNNQHAAAIPQAQDSARIINADNQNHLNSLKKNADVQQRGNAQNDLAHANGIPNDKADAKLARKRTDKTKAELKHVKAQDTANDGSVLKKQAMDSPVAGANGYAKIETIRGDPRDSAIVYKDTDKTKDKVNKDAAQAKKVAEFELPHVPEKSKDDNHIAKEPVDNMVEDRNKGKVDTAGGSIGGVPDLMDVLDNTNKNTKDAGDEDADADADEDDDDDDADVDDDDDDYYDTNNSPQRGDAKLDSGIIKVPADNEISRDVPDVNIVPNNVVVKAVEPEKEKEKEGSMKVVWDWSDFAVNFEQYVMPEQKIRRAPHSTTGEPWPMPQYYVTKKDKVYTLTKSNFRFKLSKVRCDIIEKAIERYRLFIFEDAVEDMYDNFQHAQSTMFEDPAPRYETPLYLEAPQLTMLSIKIRKPCPKYPHAKSDESYDLFIKRTGVHLWANEVWGALRGLETFTQLVFKGTNQQLYVRDTVINDYPRFTHRGIMIDSSRHFIFKETIYDVLEGMAQNKMNVMHWHLVDDQSFPFYSQVYPDLSAKGAFHPTFVYMPEDIADIIEFARMRGIRVEPEFDTPGHTYSWGLSRPDLLTQCYQGDRPVDGYLGPMDPSKNETFRFLSTFFKDVLHVFKDQYLHLGGDEVPMTCWQSNPEVVKFLGKLEGRTDGLNPQHSDPYYYSYDVRKVLEYYVNRLIRDIKNHGAKRNGGVKFVFWQEIMNNDVQLPNDTIIHVWQGGMEDVQRAMSRGLNVIFSTCWYINLIEYGTKWSKYYQCDPADTSYGYSIDESKVLGGEACLWAEYIDNENLMSTLWPSASAAAERLWSSKDLRDLDSAAARLQEHRCRMLGRGLTIGQISGPDYCLRRGKRRHLMNETSVNCTQSQCAVYSEKGRIEVEKIKVEFEQKGGRISDCSQAVLHTGSQLIFYLVLFLALAIAITLKFSKQKLTQVRVCKNKSILMIFVILILIYFMCYTSFWMQAMQFRGSFEKRVSSNVP